MEDFPTTLQDVVLPPKTRTQIFLRHRTASSTAESTLLMLTTVGVDSRVVYKTKKGKSTLFNPLSLQRPSTSKWSKRVLCFDVVTKNITIMKKEDRDGKKSLTFNVRDVVEADRRELTEESAVQFPAASKEFVFGQIALIVILNNGKRIEWACSDVDERDAWVEYFNAHMFHAELNELLKEDRDEVGGEKHKAAVMQLHRNRASINIQSYVTKFLELPEKVVQIQQAEARKERMQHEDELRLEHKKRELAKDVTRLPTASKTLPSLQEIQEDMGTVIVEDITSILSKWAIVQCKLKEDSAFVYRRVVTDTEKHCLIIALPNAAEKKELKSKFSTQPKEPTETVTINFGEDGSIFIDTNLWTPTLVLKRRRGKGSGAVVCHSAQIDPHTSYEVVAELSFSSIGDEAVRIRDEWAEQLKRLDPIFVRIQDEAAEAAAAAAKAAALLNEPADIAPPPQPLAKKRRSPSARRKGADTNIQSPSRTRNRSSAATADLPQGNLDEQTAAELVAKMGFESEVSGSLDVSSAGSVDSDWNLLSPLPKHIEQRIVHRHKERDHPEQRLMSRVAQARIDAFVDETAVPFLMGKSSLDMYGALAGVREGDGRTKFHCGTVASFNPATGRQKSLTNRRGQPASGRSSSRKEMNITSPRKIAPTPKTSRATSISRMTTEQMRRRLASL